MRADELDAVTIAAYGQQIAIGVCPICGAALRVDERSITLHDEWHRRVAQAGAAGGVGS